MNRKSNVSSRGPMVSPSFIIATVIAVMTSFAILTVIGVFMLIDTDASGVIDSKEFANVSRTYLERRAQAKKNATRKPSHTDSQHDAGMACIMAEKLIKPQLKAPTTAEFDYGHCKSSATHSGDTWTIRSYVDSDNSFGAHIRTHFVAKLTNVPPSDTWRMVSLNFEE